MDQVFRIFRRGAAWRRPCVAAILIGALSVLPVAAFGTWAIQIISDLSPNPLGHRLAIAFLSASLPEETARFASIILLFHLFRLGHTTPRESLKLALLCGLGFSVLENALYGISLGWAMGLAKFGIATPVHLTLAAIMTAFLLGPARGDNSYRPLYLVLSIVAPFLLHGIYDFSLLTALTSQSSLYSRLSPTIATYLLIMGGGVCAWRRACKPAANVEAA